MDEQKKSDADNVINLKDRKRSQKKNKFSRKGALGKDKDSGGVRFGKYTLWQYIQLIMMLAIATYLMQLCRR